MANVIYCGECSEVMREHIPDDSIDLTVTSPPYDNLRDYKGFVFPFEAIAQELWRVTKLGGVVVWVVGDATVNGSETLTSFKQAIYFRELGFNVYDTMIWSKGNVITPTEGRYYNTFEYMFILSKELPKTRNFIEDRINVSAGKVAKSITNIRKEKRNNKVKKTYITRRLGRRFNVWPVQVSSLHIDHPAPFPEALARDHIISWSNPNDIILDPMCGSGTTLKMAKEQDRQYIGIDISQEYCDLSQRRVDGARVPLPGIFSVPTNNS